jgi:hypothetical protein
MLEQQGRAEDDGLPRCRPRVSALRRLIASVQGGLEVGSALIRCEAEACDVLDQLGFAEAAAKTAAHIITQVRNAEKEGGNDE